MEHPQAPRTPEVSGPGAAATSDGTSLPAVIEDDRARRWQLLRDLAVFQAKLLVDGIKDIVLSPVSLVAAIVGLVLDRRDPGRPFYMLLRWGHGFDRWVNLFGSTPGSDTISALPPSSEPYAADSTTMSPSPTSAAAAASRDGLDAYVARLEHVLVEQYRRGGLTAKAKDAIDQALDGLGRSKPPPR